MYALFHGHIENYYCIIILAHNDSNNMTVHKYVGLHLYVLAMVVIAMAIILFYYLF